MLPERALILTIALIISGALILLWRQYTRSRLARIAADAAPPSVRELVKDSPAILYFTTQDCTQCRFQQSPILEQLSQQARVAVYAIDAVSQQDLARFYGVMTVPSTIVLNRQLNPVAINYGLTTSERLHRQITALSG